MKICFFLGIISHAQSGCLFLCMSMGYFLALIGSGYISARIFHRNTIIVSALYFIFCAKGGNFPGNPPGMESFRALFVRRGFWIMVVLFGLAISSTLRIYTMLPLYLVSEVGISRNFANTLIAVSRLFGLFSALVSGWATDRFGPCRTIMNMLVLTGVSTVLMGS